jgi:hypothetical protein
LAPADIDEPVRLPEQLGVFIGTGLKALELVDLVCRTMNGSL